MACRFSFTRLTPSQAALHSSLPVYHVYTDGAFTSVGAGAAYVVFGPRGRLLAVRKYRIPNATSAYDAEAIAFDEALLFLMNRRGPCTTHLYTDCLSLLRAISSFIIQMHASGTFSKCCASSTSWVTACAYSMSLATRA